MRVEIPGIGGNLGECVLCGNTFLSEILLGEMVQMIEVTGFNRQLPIHTKCLLVLQEIQDSGGDWRKLPEGPLKTEFAKADEEMQEVKRLPVKIPDRDVSREYQPPMEEWADPSHHEARRVK